MNKKAAITLLVLIDIGLTASGIVLGIYSFLNDTCFTLLGADIPGYIFGAAAVFLGIRNARAIQRLRRKINATGAVFSWNNLKFQRKKRMKLNYKT